MSSALVPSFPPEMVETVKACRIPLFFCFLWLLTLNELDSALSWLTKPTDKLFSLTARPVNPVNVLLLVVGLTFIARVRLAFLRMTMNTLK